MLLLSRAWFVVDAKESRLQWGQKLLNLFVCLFRTKIFMKSKAAHLIFFTNLEIDAFAQRSVIHCRHTRAKWFLKSKPVHFFTENKNNFCNQMPWVICRLCKRKCTNSLVNANLFYKSFINTNFQMIPIPSLTCNLKQKTIY